MEDGGIRLELLGAPRVLRAGTALRLPVRKTVALLAVLAVEGRCTRAKLATLLWGELDDEAARRNLRRELHRLREAGLHDVLAGDDPLALAAHVRSDLAEFAAALAGDEPAAALHAGALLDGFDLADSQAFDDWLAQARERLGRQWAQAAQSQARRLEAAGDLRGALQVQVRLIAHDPLQEAHAVDAMRLHALLGERGAALERFEQLRKTLERELGLAPLPETAALAERLRAAEQLAPLVARSGSAGLARFHAPLIGRDAELQRIAAREAVVTLLVGEPGVGKSRLADAATAAYAPRLVVCATALSRGAPLQTVAEALQRALAEPALRERVAALPALTQRELGRLLPQGDAVAEAMVEPAEPPSPALRSRFFAALADTLRALAGGGALWVDDLHWADEATLELLEAFVHRLGRERAQAGAGAALPAVVITARRHELAEHAPARELLRRLERGGLVERLELAPLPEAATLALVRALSGSAGGHKFAQRLQRATDGNPYFLLETLRFLFDTGELAIDAQGVWSTRYDDATADYAELPVPPSVEQAIVERVERLGPAAQRVLETAALADDPFTLADVQGATALSDWEAVDGLERAAQADVLADAQPGAAGAAHPAWRFAHELARQALERRLGHERRRLIHRRLAATLEAQRGRPDRIAHHLLGAGEALAAVPWWLAAARAAERVFAWREALAYHAEALAADTDATRRAATHRARHALQRQLYATGEILAEADALAALADRLPGERLEVEAQVWRIRAHNLTENFPPAVAAAEAVTALTADRATLPPALRHDLALAVAQTRHGLGDLAGAAARLDAEAAHADALAPAQRLDLHLLRAALGMTRGDLVQVQRDALDALALARVLQRIDQQAHAANLIAYVQHMQGDTPAALQTMADAQAEAERAGLVGAQRSLLTNLVKLHVALGQGGAARARLAQSMALFADTDDASTWARLRSREVEVCLLNGELGAALRAARQAVALLEGIASAAGTFWPWYQLARLLWQCGDGAAAVAVYDALPQSPAWSEMARPAVNFFRVAFRLPHDAAAVTAALAALPTGGDHSHYDQRDHAYWRALALLHAGRAAEAHATADGLAAPPFTLHAASVLALRLRVAQRAGADTVALVESARAALGSAPPLESLELLSALGVDASVRIEALATTLSEDEALRACFVARHRALNDSSI
jgi:DNA-binding SARP family transcriptional activator/predicted ATPase